MLLGVDVFKAKMKNSYHFAKRNLAQFHSAHIVVQGSPLLVRIFLLKIIYIQLSVFICRIYSILQFTGLELVE